MLKLDERSTDGSLSLEWFKATLNGSHTYSSYDLPLLILRIWWCLRQPLFSTNLEMQSCSISAKNFPQIAHQLQPWPWEGWVSQMHISKITAGISKLASNQFFLRMFGYHCNYSAKQYLKIFCLYSQSGSDMIFMDVINNFEDFSASGTDDLLLLFFPHKCEKMIFYWKT